MTEPYTQDFSLYEQAHWLKVQKFSKDYWNSFSRYNEEENKPSFSELIASSVPKENSNLQIITKLISIISLFYFTFYKINNTLRQMVCKLVSDPLVR